MAGLDPLFERRLNAILDAAEKATGAKRIITEGYRSPETQAQYYSDYKGQPVVWNGRTYQPNPAKLGRLAAPPGRSRHQIGQAADLGAGPVRDWARAHAAQFGLETLRGGVDQPHIQLAGGKGITGPVSSTVPGTTATQPAADAPAAPPTPESSVADMLSKASFGGGGGGGSQSAGLGGTLPPAPEFNLQTTPVGDASAPAAAAPDLSPLAGLFGLPTIGQPGGAVAPDGTLPDTQPGFIPGQAWQPLKRLGM